MCKRKQHWPWQGQKQAQPLKWETKAVLIALGQNLASRRPASFFCRFGCNSRIQKKRTDKSDNTAVNQQINTETIKNNFP